jgi:hypothetical protein
MCSFVNDTVARLLSCSYLTGPNRRVKKLDNPAINHPLAASLHTEQCRCQWKKTIGFFTGK